MDPRVLTRLAILTAILGLALGFIPAYTADGDSFGEGITCGSPFVGNGDDLTGTGLAECETAGGLSTRRAWAWGLLGVAAILGIDAAMQAQLEAGRKTRASLADPFATVADAGLTD